MFFRLSVMWSVLSIGTSRDLAVYGDDKKQSGGGNQGFYRDAETLGPTP